MLTDIVFLLFLKNYEEFLELQELSAFADNFSTCGSSKVWVFSCKKSCFICNSVIVNISVNKNGRYANFASFHQTSYLQDKHKALVRTFIRRYSKTLTELFEGFQIQ